MIKKTIWNTLDFSSSTGWQILCLTGVLACLLAGCRTSDPPTAAPESAVSPPPNLQVSDIPTAAASPSKLGITQPSLDILSDPTATPELFPSPTPSPTSTALPLPTPTPAPPAQSIYGTDLELLSARGGLTQVITTNSAWVRGIEISWNAVEPNPGARNWNTLARVENELITAAQNGLTALVIVSDTPAWARQFQGIACGPIHVDHLAAFGSFFQEVVARYSQPPYEVKYWEIWNEPDIGLDSVPPRSKFGCWGDKNDPYYGGGQYGEMLKAVYPQVKNADPEAQVLVGGLLLDCNPANPPETAPGVYKDCSSGNFLRGILENGAGDFFDGVSFHAYDYYYAALGDYRNPNWHSSWDKTGPVLIAKTRFLKNLLAEYGVQDKILLNTELALLCGRDGKEGICQTLAFNTTKANYLAQAYTAAQAEGLEANLWYSLLGWRGSGLVRVNLNPLPAFTAYQFGADVLAQAAYWGAITDYPQVRGYRFNRTGTELWVLWSLTAEPQTVLLPNYPAAVYDVYGEPLPRERALEITLAPVYIEW